MVRRHERLDAYEAAAEARVKRCLRALSVRQPWAKLIWSRRKWFETRTWNTTFRGEFLIHASMKVEKKILADFILEDRFSVLRGELPTGAAIALAEIFDSRPMEPDDEFGACCLTYPKAHVFCLRNVRSIEPIPMKGKLNFFKTDILPEDLKFI